MSASEPTEIAETIAAETGVPVEVVLEVLALADEGATVPFIARYRKERTRGLDEVGIRAVLEAKERVVQFVARRETIRGQLEQQGVLTAELERRLEGCRTRTELEDFYLPYKQKRRTKATEAIERGLEPLALRILAQPERADPLADALPFVNEERGVPTPQDALKGAGDIVVERIACDSDLKSALREAFAQNGDVVCKKSKAALGQRTRFDDYEDHCEPIRTIPSHRFLALRRGAEEEVLDVRLELDKPRTLGFIERRFGMNERSPYGELLRDAVKDAWSARLRKSLETELLATLKERADLEAARIFAENLEHLLLAAPLGGKAVLGIDPGFRSGCKCAAINESGRFLATVTLYPHQGAKSETDAGVTLVRFLDAHPVAAIAVGNGTAGRETEAFVRAALKGTRHQELIVTSVSESGASVYSASDLAREEFPDLDLTIRGAISIARRLQDPLAELVKVDPRSIGVGQYQHDVHQPLLNKKLGDVVESCVNRVGVELNTASASLLTHVAGIGATMATRIVAHREAHGAFSSRRVLLKVAGLGRKTFEQAAGFLRVQASDEALDRSAVHPERYPLVRDMAKDLGVSVESLVGDAELADRVDISRYVRDDVGEPTLRDIIAELKRPGRDPRESFEPPRFRDDVTTLADVEVGMVLEGIVTNVTAFGAFVDIGVHNDGLVHKSALWRRVREPAELVHVGDRLRVTVLEVDVERQRIALSAEKP